MKKIFCFYKKLPKAAKASMWFVICGFLQKAISLITTPIFTRLLSTSEYGVFNVFSTWQNIVIVVASLNLAAGVYLRGLIKYEEDREEFTVSLQMLYVVCTSIVFAFYLLFSDFWEDLFGLSDVYIYLMFVDILVTTAYNFWSSRQRVEYEYRKLIIVTLLNTVIKPILGIIAVLNFEDRVTARIVTFVIADVIVFGYFFLKIFFHKGIRLSTKYWKYALGYNLPLLPHYLAQIILNQSDRVMIDSMVGSSEAGIYSLAYTAASLLLIINQSILNSYNPWMYRKIKNKEYHDINKMSISLLLLVGAMNLLLIGFAPEAIAVFAPSSYYEAIWVIPPVSASVFFMFMYNLFSNFEFYYEKTKLMMIASVFGAILNIILNRIFIRQFGYLAAGYTTLACYLFYCFFHYCAMKIILKKELNGIRIYNIKTVLTTSIAFIALCGSFMLLYNHTAVRYGILGGSAILIFLFRKHIIHRLRAVLDMRKE